MKQRIVFLLRYYALTVALFLCAKVVFMAVCRKAHPFTLSDVADVLRHGLTLDLSTGLYFLVVPFLLTVVSIWLSGRWLHVAMRLWFAVVAVAFALGFAADTALYPHWGYKLDATCLQYLSNPAGAAASVSVPFLVAGLAGLVVLILVIYLLFHLQYRPLQPLRRRLPYGLLCLVAAPLIFIGMRGGLDKSTTNIGQVYYSQTPFLNHAAVNPIFSFLASFESTVRTDVTYHFFGDEECARLTQGLFDTRSVNPDSLLNTRRPDIILVMLESAGGQFTKINGRDDIMPAFNRMTDQGIYFSQCYANSFRTDRATVSIWSGYPAFPTMSLQKDPRRNATLPGIARSLRQAGYSSTYFYGGDINFTKKGSYLINAGFEKLVWKEDFTRQEQRTAQWGVRDDIVFQRIVREVKGWDASSRGTHLIGYNTLSSHQPWDVPISEMEDEVENAFRYLDHCMERFIDSLRQLPQWDNLLVIFIPDHGIEHAGISENSPVRAHVPVLWMGGAVRQPRVIGVPCNQTDQAATLLGQLGLPHDEYLFSRDVLSETYTKPFAFHTFNNGFSLADSTRFVVYDLTAQRTVVGDAPDLVERGKAILQVTSQDLSRR